MTSAVESRPRGTGWCCASGGPALAAGLRSIGRVTLALTLAAALPTAVDGQQPVQNIGRPTLSIGMMDGPEADQLYAVRNAFRLPDGRIVVPNSGTGQVRLYSADGRSLLVSVGRKGDGPGEYRSIDWVLPYRGDSLAVFDGEAQRLTLLRPDGKLGRVLTLGVAGGVGTRAGGASAARSRRMFAEGVFADGSFLARQGELSVTTGDTTSVRRDLFRYVHLDPDGNVVADLFSLPDQESFVWSDGQSVSTRPRAFGLVTAVAVHLDHVYAADGSGFRVRVLDGEGSAVTVLDAGRPPRPVTAADRKRWTDAELAAAGDGLFSNVRKSAIRNMSFPERMPPHGRLVVAQEGAVWLEEYLPPHADGQPTWTVFEADGTVRARVLFPVGFRLTWVGGDEALGVLVDELDVERVVAYRVPAPPR